MRLVFLGEILKEQAQLAEAENIHQMGVINDGGEHFADVIEALRFLDEA